MHAAVHCLAGAPKSRGLAHSPRSMTWRCRRAMGALGLGRSPIGPLAQPRRPRSPYEPRVLNGSWPSPGSTLKIPDTGQMVSFLQQRELAVADSRRGTRRAIFTVLAMPTATNPCSSSVLGFNFTNVLELTDEETHRFGNRDHQGKEPPLYNSYPTHHTPPPLFLRTHHYC